MKISLPFRKTKNECQPGLSANSKRLIEDIIQAAKEGHLLSIGEGKGRVSLGKFNAGDELPNQIPGDAKQGVVIEPGLFIQKTGIVSYGDYEEEKVHWFHLKSDAGAVRALSSLPETTLENLSKSVSAPSMMPTIDL